VSVLLVTSDPPRARAAVGRDLPAISVSEPEEQIVEALEEAELSQVLVAGQPNALLTVVTAVFTEKLGRRHVLRLPETDTRDLDARIATGASAHPFAPGVTRAAIEDRVDAGAAVRLVDAVDERSMLPLASVSAERTVDLQTAAKGPNPGDAVIALVGGPAWPARA
jgi:hypothetical protein